MSEPSDIAAICRQFVEAQAHGRRWSEEEIRRRTAKVLDAIEAPLAVPKSWEEAKALMPDLQSWAEFKKANPEKNIIDYLADPDGFGRWTLVEPGIPRPALKHLYPANPEKPLAGSPYEGLKAWLKGTDEKGERNRIPSSVHLPDITKETDRLAALASEPGEMPSHVAMALRSREARAKAKGGHA